MFFSEILTSQGPQHVLNQITAFKVTTSEFPVGRQNPDREWESAMLSAYWWGVWVCGLCVLCLFNFDYKQYIFFFFTFNCIAVLHGPGLLREHCVLENCAGTVTLIPQDGALCSVNGSVVTNSCQLTQGKYFCNANILLRAISSILDWSYAIIASHLQMKCSFMSHALPRLHTRGMAEWWTPHSTGQMPFLLLNILKGERPRTKLQTKLQALHLIGRWRW